MKRDRILIVDDDPSLRWTVRQRLEQEGYPVVEAGTAAQALDQTRAGADLVLLDYRLPDAEGYELLEQLLELEPAAQVIMLTGHANVERAVRAMQLGARHYVEKPFELEALVQLVGHAAEAARVQRSVRALHAGTAVALDSIVGQSPQMQHCRQLLGRVACSPSSTVLLTGDSGTGKDLAARAIHQGSDRAGGPFVNITCTALSPNLLESELFGHERGAFTDARVRKQGLLAQAHGGTVFLDEIGEMEPGLQAKLLRVIEDKTFRPVGGNADVRTDVRVIAATNVDLAAAVRRRAFREDLYYRLAVLTVHLPPLREREGDVELLLQFFVQHFAAQFHKQVRRVSRATLRRLEAYPWPGNVRELRNAVERAVLLASGPVLGSRDFEMLPGGARAPSRPAVLELPAGGVNLRELERTLMIQALRRTGGNRTMAGTLLGLNRDQVRYRIDKYNIAVNGAGGER